MKRLNLKLAISLVVGTLFVVVSVVIAHGLQQRNTAGTLKKEADALVQEGKKEEALKKYIAYLQQNEDDADVYLITSKLAVEIVDANPSKTTARQALDELNKAYRRNRDNPELRERMATFLMKLGLFDEAREHLEWLTSRERGKHPAKFDLMLATCYRARDFTAKAMDIYATLAGYDLNTYRFVKKAVAPEEIDSYIFLAELMREKLDPKKPAEADAAMEQLVSVNKDSSKAHLARAAYLYKYADSDKQKQDARKAIAKEELAAAEKLAPDDASVILFGAEMAQKDNELERAEKLLVRGLKLYPKSFPMYYQWTVLKLNQKQVLEARKQIDDGLAKMPGNPDLLLLLVDVQLQQGDLVGARETTTKLSGTSIRLELLGLVQAKLLFYEQKWLEAAQQAEQLRPKLAGPNDYAIQADLLMAQCYDRLGQYDKQLEASRRVLAVDKTNVAGLVGEASALMGLGRTLEAQRKYEVIGRQMGSKAMITPQVWVPIVELRIAEVMKQPPDKRNWSQVDRLVEWMEKNGSATDPATALVKGEVQFRKGDVDGAFKTFDAARAEHPKDSALWSAVAKMVVLQKGKGPAAALKLLDQAPEEIRGTTTMRLKRAELLIAQGGDRVKTTIAELDAGSEKLAAAERSRLWSGLGIALLSIGDRDGAMKFWIKVADADPSDLKIRFNLLDVARETGDEAIFTRVLDDMRRLKNSVEAQYVQAAQMVALAKKAVRSRSKGSRLTAPLESDEKVTLGAARKLLNQVSQSRPNWYEVSRVLADADLLEGNHDSAIANLQEALKTGPANPATIKTLVMLLSQAGRINEVEPLLETYGRDSFDAMQIGRVVPEVDLKKDPEGALKRAAIEVPDDSRDPYGHMWLGHLYDRAKKPDQAEASFRRAVKSGPNLPETWLVLVNHLMTFKKDSEVRKVLMEARKALPEDHVNQVLGPGYEALGELELAEQYYRAALEATPNDLATHRLAAMFFLRTHRMDEARREVAFVLKGAQNDAKDRPHLLWSRRALADILADTGDLEDFKKAKALLIANTKTSPDESDDQIRLASLLARRFDEPAMLRESLKWYESVKSLSPEDRMTVARIHEVLGNWTLARTEMLALVSQPKADPAVYLSFIEMLVRINQISDADTWLKQLNAAYPTSEQLLRTLLLRTRVLVKKGRPDEAVALLSRMLPPPPVPKDQIGSLRTVALLMDHEGLNGTAEKLYREYMTYDPDMGTLQLAAFLGRAGRLDEALDLLEPRINGPSLKSEARHTVLEVVSEVLHGQPSRIQPRHLERVKGWFDRLLREDPESAPLLLQFADFQMIAGQDDKTEKIYRDVLNRSDIGAAQKAIAYNNLAFVLASQRKNLPEALDLINRAGAVLGFRSDVLDTRGMVYLAMNKYSEAVADFSDAVLVNNPSAVKLLHLAMAQNLSLDRPAAKATLRRANDAKLDRGALSKTEQAFFDRLMKDVGP